MTNKNSGLVITKKITFVLAAILFLVSSFMPMFYVAATSFLSQAGAFAFALLLICFVAGFVLVMFGDKKYFVIGSGLNLVAPIASFLFFLNSVVMGAANGVYLGAILNIVAIVLYCVSYVCHSIYSYVNKETLNNDTDKRIELVKDYKSWKDEGIITEEEYEAKKAEILHLNSKKENKK